MKYSEMSPEQRVAHYERTTKWRLANKEKINAYANKHYHANKEKCAERAAKWRAANLEYIKEKQRADKRQRKEQAIQYLGGTCQKCSGTFPPAVYEFHHTDPLTKDKDPSKMLQLSWKRLSAELDKCQLLCANCHRITHHGESY